MPYERNYLKRVRRRYQIKYDVVSILQFRLLDQVQPRFFEGLMVDAVHCVIWNIPPSFLASDVKRLVSHDPTKERQHPLIEGSQQ